MLNCKECIINQDDYLDNQLPHALYEDMTSHLAVCPECQAMMRENRELLQGLRTLESPPPSPGFLKLAMENAVRAERQRLHKKWFFQYAAVAAMVCLVVLVSLKFSPWMAPNPNTGQSAPGVILSLHESKDVILLVQSARALDNATITINLPPQLMLANNPGLRQISWQADIKAGKNLIPLPLVATVAGLTKITAKIEHEDRVKAMSMQVEVVPVPQV